MNEKIAVEDNIEFRTIKSICQFFGRNSFPVRSSFFKMEHDETLTSKYMLWCPKKAKSLTVPFGISSDWINVLDKPASGQIYEKNINPNKNSITKRDQIDKLRICFMLQRLPNNQKVYIFCGIYKYLRQNADGARIYQKISNEIDIAPFINYYTNLKTSK